MRRPDVLARMALALAGCAAGFVPEPVLAQTSLVLYRDGGVQVSRTLPIALPKGRSEHRVELDQFEPGTLIPLDAGVTLAGVQYPRHLSEENLLLASVGRRLLFLQPGTRDTVSAVVLAEPLRFQLASGQVQLTLPGTPLFPKELSSRSTLLVVESERALPKLSLGYLTSGGSWRAEYAVLLNGPSAEVSGRVVLQSAELRMDSAEVMVLEGRPSRAAVFQRDRASAREEDEARVFLRGMAVTGAMSVGSLAAPAGVGGFRVYAVPGRHSFVPGQAAVVPLFSPIRVTMGSVYRVTGAPLQAGTGEASLPVETRFLFDRPRESAFGAQALPPGIMRMYGKVGASQVLLGEVDVQHLDPGLKLDLSAGQAVHLVATRRTGTPTLVQDSLQDGEGRVRPVSSATVFDTEVRIMNSSDSSATIEYDQVMPQTWRLVSSSAPGSRDAAAGSTRFRITVPARGEATLTFRVRTS